MNKLESINLIILLFLIDKYNNEVDIKYLIEDMMEDNSLDSFIKNNGSDLLDTIDYIEAYNNLLNELNTLNLEHSNTSNLYLLNPSFIDILIDIHKKKRDEEVIRNILSNQKIVLSNLINRTRNYLSIIIGKNNNLDELLNEFKQILKYYYGIKKKNIKLKVLVKG